MSTLGYPAPASTNNQSQFYFKRAKTLYLCFQAVTQPTKDKHSQTEFSSTELAVQTLIRFPTTRYN